MMESEHRSNGNFLAVNADENSEVLRGLASPVRVRKLKLLTARGPLNVNEIRDALDLPQSTVATNVQVLESSGLGMWRTVATYLAGA